MAGYSTRDYMAALQRKYRATLQPSEVVSVPQPAQEQNPIAWGSTLEPEKRPSWLESAGSPTNPVGAIIDILSRPVYGVGRVLRETKEGAEEAQGKNIGSLLAQFPIQHLQNQIKGLREVVAPERRELPSEVVLEEWKPESGGEKVGRFLAGLGLDIATDPLTYVGAGAIRAAGRAIPGATKLGEALTRGQKPLPNRPLPPKVSEEVVEDVASQAPKVASDVPANTGPLQIEAPPAKPSTLLLEAGPIGRRTQAIRQAQKTEESLAKKLADGTYVYQAGKSGVEIAPSRALTWAVDSKGVASKEPSRYRVLENTGTGELRPYNPSLKNLRRTAPKYPGVEPEPFMGMFVRSVDEQTLDALMASSKYKTTAQGRALTYEMWEKSALKAKAYTTVNGNKYSISDLIALKLGAAKNPERVEIATRALRNAYEGYLRNYAKARESVKADLLRQAEDTSREALGAAWAADKIRPVRLTGDELEALKTKIKETFDAKDAATILGKKSQESYEEAIKSVLSQKQKVPTFVEKILDSGAPRPFSSQIADFLTDTPMTLGGGAIPTTASGKASKSLLDEASQGIKPAREIVEEATPGASISPAVTEISRGSELDEITYSALAYALGPKGQQWAERATDFQWTTNFQRTARNSPTPRQGLGVNREAFNTMAQANAWRVVMGEGSKQASQLGLSGLKRSQWLLNAEGYNLIGKIKAYEKFLRVNGAEPIVSVTKQGWPVGLGDVLDVLYTKSNSAARSFVERRVMSNIGISQRGQKGVRGTVQPTALLEAVRVILDTINPNWTKINTLEGDIEALLKKALSGDNKPLLDSLGKALLGPGIKSRGAMVDNANAATVLDEAMKAFFNVDTIRGLLQAAHNNAANSTIQLVDTVRQLSQETMSRIVSILHDRAASIGDSVNALNKIDEGVKLSAVHQPMHVSGDAVKVAESAIKDELPTFVRVSDVQGAEHIRRATTGLLNGDQNAVAAAGLTRTKQAVAEALDDIPKEALEDSAHVAEVAIQAGLLAKMAPIRSKLSEFFVAHHENATLHNAIIRGESVMRNMQSAWRRELNWVNHLVKKGEVDSEHVVEAFKYLQGRIPNPSPQAQLVIERLTPAVENIFETGRGKAPGIFGAFFREGYDVNHLINKMENARYALKPEWRFDLKAATKEGKLDLEALANQWKSWDIDDPLEFMAKMQTLAGSMQLDMAVANEAYRLANSLGYASRSQRKGFVQFNQADSVIGLYMPKGIWVDPLILKEIRRMDDILSQSEAFTSSFGQFVNKYLDPILNTWKSGVTVWNPGHHGRNFIGDSALSFFADGVKNPKYYIRAAQTLHLRSKYTTWDALAALRGMERVPLAEGSIVATSRNGIQVTEKQLFDGLLNRGALPSAAVSEDLLETMASPTIAAVQQKLAITGGRARNIVGRVSESRDDLVRLAHGMHVIEHNSFKNIEEALDFAANRVRRWHPDGLGLTGKERQIMRRIFPFYSWTRKTIPLIIESMVLQPGRILVAPKASYNFAQSQGIDLNSLSDPFPEDQLFPSYFRNDVLGPQIRDDQNQYIGINPGIPSVDILNEFVPDFTNAASGSDFIREMLGGPIGMLSPLIKSPVEAITGTRVDTASRVGDLGEYFDSQIPGVNKVSSVTGVSPIGTLLNTLPGGEAGLDYRRAVEKGNRDPNWDLGAFLNYIAGIGTRNMSTPSGVNQAEIELRNRISRQRDKQGGIT